MDEDLLLVATDFAWRGRWFGDWLRDERERDCRNRQPQRFSFGGAKFGFNRDVARRICWIFDSRIKQRRQVHFCYMRDWCFISLLRRWIKKDVPIYIRNVFLF